METGKLSGGKIRSASSAGRNKSCDFRSSQRYRQFITITFRVWFSFDRNDGGVWSVSRSCSAVLFGFDFVWVARGQGFRMSKIFNWSIFFYKNYGLVYTFGQYCWKTLKIFFIIHPRLIVHLRPSFCKATKLRKRPNIPVTIIGSVQSCGRDTSPASSEALERTFRTVNPANPVGLCAPIAHRKRSANFASGPRVRFVHITSKLGAAVCVVAAAVECRGFVFIVLLRVCN